MLFWVNAGLLVLPCIGWSYQKRTYLLDNFTCSVSIITKFAREIVFAWKSFREFFFETWFLCGLLVAHDLPMICLWSPVYLQAATVKMRKKSCTCKKFSIFQKFGKNARNAKKKCDFFAFFLNKERVFHSTKITKMHYKFSFFYIGNAVFLI